MRLPFLGTHLPPTTLGVSTVPKRFSRKTSASIIRTYKEIMRLAFVLWALSMSIGKGADPLDQWTWRNPLPQGNSLYGVVYANGTYVAVGAVGTILTSTNTVAWVNQSSRTTQTLRDVAYGNGIFVTVGYN